MIFTAQFMVVILDGNSEHDAHVWRKNHQICDCCRSKQVPWKDYDPMLRSNISTMVQLVS